MTIVDEIREAVGSDKAIKYIAAVIVVACMVIFISLYYYSAVKYRVLFMEMNDRDLSLVSQTLMEKNIDYKLDDKKAAISVKETDVDKVRMLIMTEGVLSNTNIGFEVFDDVEFGMTEFSQKINYQRALQGELSRTISSLEEIKYARVHIVQPSTKLFRTNDDKPSASIILFMKLNKSLSALQIKGIQNIVSASVEDMDINDVIVSDQSGIVLSERIDLNRENMSSKLSHKEKIELYYLAKTKKVLDSELGENHYTVSVNVEFDYTKSVKTIESYSSAKDNGVVTRNRSTKNGKGGIETSDKEYKYGKEVSNVEEEAGRIKRLNIGVIVPANATDDEMVLLKSVIEMAAGIDVTRGDMVSIHKTSSMDSLSNQTIDEEASGLVSTPIEILQPQKVLGVDDDQIVIQAGVSSFNNLFSQISNRIGISEINLILACGALLLLSLLINVFYILNRRRFDSRLSKLDRQKLLDEISDWFEKSDKYVA